MRSQPTGSLEQVNEKSGKALLLAQQQKSFGGNSKLQLA
jgi:hypothetical protein